MDMKFRQNNYLNKNTAIGVPFCILRKSYFYIFLKTMEKNRKTMGTNIFDIFFRQKKSTIILYSNLVLFSPL